MSQSTPIAGKSAADSQFANDHFPLSSRVYIRCMKDRVIDELTPEFHSAAVKLPLHICISVCDISIRS
jgi:hypothetical protein